MPRRPVTLRSRREFLQSGGSAADAELHLLRAGRPAMGCLCEIIVDRELRDRLEVIHEALDEIRRLESLMTVFQEDSELVKINRTADMGPVKVSRELFELLRLSVQISRETGGAFDISSGALWKCWGFHRREGRVPSSTELEDALSRSGFENLCINEEAETIEFSRRGIELNLGSIGKGFALDRAAIILQNGGVSSALLHAGQSSFLAAGDSRPVGAGWKVGIRDPRNPGRDILTLRLRRQGMATSGVGVQFFERDKKRHGHIIDPRNGWPAEQNLSVTVISDRASVADALSTAFFIMQPEEVQRYCEAREGIGAIVIPAPGEGEKLRVHCWGEAALPSAGIEMMDS